MPVPTRADHTKLVADCYEAAQKVFAIMGRASDPAWLSLDLTMGQFKAMMTLSTYGPQPVGELGRRLGLSEPATSLLVDKLESRSLAVRERDSQDRRRSIVTLTPAAVTLTASLREGREAHVEQWLGALETEELRGLREGFRGLLRVAESDEASPTASAGTGAADAEAQAHHG
jgi:DNA-binding MarR family transcriptional regulator